MWWPTVAAQGVCARLRVMCGRTVRMLQAGVVALCLCGGLAGHAAPKDPLLRLHPGAKDLEGLVVVEGSHQYGKGEGLTAIYNGGYQRFTKAGVTRASQRYYSLGGHNLELVIHEVRDERKARALFENSCRDGKATVQSVPVGAKTVKVCTATQDGSSYGYLLSGRYYVSTTMDKPLEKHVRMLLEATAHRILGVKPKKGK